MTLPVKSLSASKVDCFFNCKRLFKYRYIAPPFPPPFNKYFIIGNTVHKALEMFHKELKEMDKLSVGALNSLMSKCFKASVTTYKILDKQRTGRLSNSDVFGMKTMLKKYLDVSKVRELPESLFIEKMFNTKIGEVKVRGKADRVDVCSNGHGKKKVTIIDYKTSSKPLTKKEIAESVQLGTYAIWILKEVDAEAEIYGRYIFLKHMDTSKEGKVFPITKDIVAEVIEKYMRVGLELQHNCKFTRNTKFKYCYSCDFSRHCGKDTNDGI